MKAKDMNQIISGITQGNGYVSYIFREHKSSEASKKKVTLKQNISLSQNNINDCQLLYNERRKSIAIDEIKRRNCAGPNRLITLDTHCLSASPYRQNVCELPSPDIWGGVIMDHNTTQRIIRTANEIESLKHSKKNNKIYYSSAEINSANTSAINRHTTRLTNPRSVANNGQGYCMSAGVDEMHDHGSYFSFLGINKLKKKEDGNKDESRDNNKSGKLKMNSRIKSSSQIHDPNLYYNPLLTKKERDNSLQRVSSEILNKNCIDEEEEEEACMYSNESDGSQSNSNTMIQSNRVQVVESLHKRATSELCVVNNPKSRMQGNRVISGNWAINNRNNINTPITLPTTPITPVTPITPLTPNSAYPSLDSANSNSTNSLYSPAALGNQNLILTKKSPLAMNDSVYRSDEDNSLSINTFSNPEMNSSNEDLLMNSVSQPNIQEIEMWHLVHKPPKTIRSTRFNFNKATASSRPPFLVFQSLCWALNEMKPLYKDRFFYARQPDLYLFECHLLNETKNEVLIKFEVEVCKIWLLKMHGVRFKRLTGSSFLYEELYNQIVSFLKYDLQQSPTK